MNRSMYSDAITFFDFDDTLQVPEKHALNGTLKQEQSHKNTGHQEK